MLALDVSRVEAGLLLIDVDFNSSKKALVDEQRYSPFEMGLGRLVNLDKNRFVGQAALDRRTEARSRARDCRPGDRLAAGRESLRSSWLAAGGFADRVASCRAGVQGRHSGWQSDDEHLVANVEEDDCARDGETRVHASGNAIAV